VEQILSSGPKTDVSGAGSHRNGNGVVSVLNLPLNALLSERPVNILLSKQCLILFTDLNISRIKELNSFAFYSPGAPLSFLAFF